MDRCANPSFGPAEYSIRLDHAAHLLERRASLGTGQPLSEIAYACGFRDYVHFARRVRHRFGHAPGAHCEGSTAIESGWSASVLVSIRQPLTTSSA